MKLDRAQCCYDLNQYPVRLDYISFLISISGFFLHPTTIQRDVCFQKPRHASLVVPKKSIVVFGSSSFYQASFLASFIMCYFCGFLFFLLFKLHSVPKCQKTYLFHSQPFKTFISATTSKIVHQKQRDLCTNSESHLMHQKPIVLEVLWNSSYIQSYRCCFDYNLNIYTKPSVNNKVGTILITSKRNF